MTTSKEIRLGKEGEHLVHSFGGNTAIYTNTFISYLVTSILMSMDGLKMYSQR